MNGREERTVLSGSHLFINKMDLVWSGLGFPWEICFVQSVLASPEGS